MAPKDRSAVRRPLVVGDRGDDVRVLRSATRARARHLKIPVPDWFRKEGALSKKEVKYISQIAVAMGAGPKNRIAFGKLRISPNAQRLIRKSRKKTPRENAATKKRVGYRQTLRRRYRTPLRVRAYKVAAGLVGVMEQGGNNMGPVVSKIILGNGGVIGEPWCGDFMAYCYRLAGSKLVQRLWASVYYLGTLTGLLKTSTPLLGNLVRFIFDHVGMFVAWVRWDGSKWARCDRSEAEAIETIEGNTGASGAVSDSATGGDGVYRKIRPLSLVQDYLNVTS